MSNELWRPLANGMQFIDYTISLYDNESSSRSNIALLVLRLTCVRACDGAIATAAVIDKVCRCI